MKYSATLLLIAFLFYGCIHHDFKKEGGIRIVMEVAQGDLLKEDLRSNDSIAVATINETYKEYNQQGDKSFYSLYFSKLEKADPHTVAGAHFRVKGLTPTSTAAECTAFFEKELKEKTIAMEKSLMMRIDALGIVESGIYQGEKPGQILVELPGKSDLQRVRKLLQSSSKLAFWETYNNTDVIPSLEALDSILGKEASVAPADTIEKKQEPVTDKSSLRAQLDAQNAEEEKKAKELDARYEKELRSEHPLYTLLTLTTIFSGNERSVPTGPVVGTANYKDTAKINGYLNGAAFKKLKRSDLKLLWSATGLGMKHDEFQLIAIKTNGKNSAPLSGNCVEKAKTVFDRSSGGSPQISMKMTTDGAFIWRTLTRDNIGRSIAIVLDDQVYSWPNVQGEISGGVSSITGNFNLTDADDLVNVLNSGSLPMTVRIVEENVVAPGGK